MELICKCILLILHGLLILMLDNSIRLRTLVGQRLGDVENGSFGGMLILPLADVGAAIDVIVVVFMVDAFLFVVRLRGR
jgi:hypothetical protein